MKTADAPQAGWYPDPEGGVRLRWWDGTDWTERYRARPNLAAPLTNIHGATRPTPGLPTDPVRTELGAARRESAEIIAEVRRAARSEVDRAADLFSARARAATRDIEPLISQYTSRLLRWVKIVVAVVLVLVVAWFVFQAIAQATFFEWIGDRIDNVVDRSSD